MKTPEPVSAAAPCQARDVAAAAHTAGIPASVNGSPPSPQATAKIGLRHLERLAVVYIRQSNPQQVVNNRESRERQYALVDRAVALGWPRDRVRVVDGDQGHSGRTTAKRTGFQELLVDVNLDRIGLILGLEMSRMSRSCRDTYQLMEVCGIFGTLLGDFDGIYDPTEVNDRLLLGLKATISEVELHTMRSRLILGKLNKARRGELFSLVPRGYIRTADGSVALDPDEQVQSTLRLVFATFEDLKSVHGVLRYLVANGIRLPVRPHRGHDRGQLLWQAPALWTLQQMLRNPIYAGAYCYGRSHVDPRRARGESSGSGRRWVPAEQAEVLLHDCLPAYISWQQFQNNQRQMAENRSAYDRRGVPRRGTALLAGLLVCGRCGYRLRVSYGSRQQPRYMCTAHQALHGERACQSLEGNTVNDLVSKQVLRALEPAALELSLQAAADIETERRRQQQQWELRLERARYDSERAARQYHAVEPEHRLVARSLERDWERALAAQSELEAEYARWQRDSPPQLTPQERQQIESLAQNIPALWNAPHATDADRKTIVRLLIDKIVVAVEGSSEVVQATIHWAGGYESQHEFQRRVASFRQLTDFEQLVSRVASLHASGHTRAEIATRLNEEGFKPPQRGTAFGRGGVARLLLLIRSRNKETTVDEAGTATDSDSPPGTDEWRAGELARVLEVPVRTLHYWHHCGWLHGRKHRGWPARWIYYADAGELKRLQNLRDYRRPDRTAPYPAELTTPATRHQT